MHRGLACGGAQSPPGLDVACRDCLTEYRDWSPKSGDANTSKDKNRAGCCGSTPDWLVSRCHPTKRNYSASPRQCKTSHPDLSGYSPRNTADRLKICAAWLFHPRSPTFRTGRLSLAGPAIPHGGVVSIPPGNGLPSQTQATPPPSTRQRRDRQPRRDHVKHGHRVQRGQALSAGSSPALGKTGSMAV